MSANDRQVGGDHYKTGYQHWDLVINLRLNYLEGCTTKYLIRWRKKNGLQDLEKGLHYLDKLIEMAGDNVPGFFGKYGHCESRKGLRYKWKEVEEDGSVLPITIDGELRKFFAANELTKEEREFVKSICLCEHMDDLRKARGIVLKLIGEQSGTVPGTPEDGGHHARNEVA